MQKNKENNIDLDTQFADAFDKISKLKEAVAPDVMLKFYAYYKQANFGNKLLSNNNLDTRNAFKLNAWMQLKGMSEKKAKKEYIKLAHIVLTQNKK